MKIPGRKNWLFLLLKSGKIQNEYRQDQEQEVYDHIYCEIHSGYAEQSCLEYNNSFSSQNVLFKNRGFCFIFL